jgi:threonine/homoserine/homoserine lactone efflux protein
MAKGGVRPRVGGGGAVSSSNGIFNSGIFGMIGSTVHCNSTDNSVFCTLMKIVNGIMALAIISGVIYLIWMGWKMYMKKRR